MKIILIVLIYILIDSTHTIESNNKRIVCYYGSWSVYRNGDGQFNVDHIDPFLCTHIIYTFFGIDENGDVIILDPSLDLEDNFGKGNIRKFNELKLINPELKTIAAVGGWAQGSVNFSIVAADAIKRYQFAQNCMLLCLQYGFDGIDIDWEYPGQRGGNPSIDKDNFVLMLEELYRELSSKHLILSAAVAAAEFSADISYDIPNVMKNLDFVNIMTYDFHGSWESTIGIVAPLYKSSIDITIIQQQLNGNASVNYWLNKGAPSHQLNMGIPFYGCTFTLSDVTKTVIGSLNDGPGLGGPYTNEPGSMGFNEFCEQKYTHNWIRDWETEQAVPYAYQTNQWIGYDDLESIEIKSNFIKSLNLGGAMIWTIDQDDFRGNCENGQYPLLNKINAILLPNDEITTIEPPTTTPVTTTSVEDVTTITTTTTTTTVNDVETTTVNDVETATVNDVETTTVNDVETTTVNDIETTTVNDVETTTVNDIETTTVTDVETTTVSDVITTTSPPNIEFTCIHDGFFADPNDCRYFYRCIGLIGHRFVCPNNLYFDLTHNVCNWPALVDCIQT